jgi:hypothetical protein
MKLKEKKDNVIEDRIKKFLEVFHDANISDNIIERRLNKVRKDLERKVSK